MSTNKLPLSYSLPPPPPSSGKGKGRGKGKGKDRSQGRFEALFGQNNKPESIQQNNFQHVSQQLESTSSTSITSSSLDKIIKDDQLLDSKKNDLDLLYKKRADLESKKSKNSEISLNKNRIGLDLKNNDITSIYKSRFGLDSTINSLYKKRLELEKKRNELAKKQLELMRSMSSKKRNNTLSKKNVVHQKKSSSKNTSQDQFMNLLNSFNSNIFDEVLKNLEGKDNKPNLLSQKSNDSDDKDHNLSFLSKNQASSSKKGKQLKGQAIPSYSNLSTSQIKFPASINSGQNSKITSPSQSKIPVPPDNKQDGTIYEAGFAAAAKAALAATSALQYNKHNIVQKIDSNYQTNNKSELRCENCAQVFTKETQLNQHKKRNLCGSKSANDESRLKPVMDFRLDTPEAIAKWIEQRKKNYPTEANIARKKELEAARIAHGKVLKAQAQASKKRSFDQSNAQRSNNATKKIRLENGPCGVTDLMVAASSANTSFTSSSINSKINRLIQPVLSMLSGNPNQLTGKIFINNKNFQTTTVSSKKNNKPTGNLYRKVCLKYRQGHCPIGKGCTNKHTGKMICPPVQRPPDDVRCRQRNLRELLLYKEMVEEKNVILQCIRHIVNNNFFGVVTNKSIKDAKKRGEALVVEIGNQHTHH
ncbi:hypothetical protein C1645_734227 [Glomus cerebriforme]|uniref:C3H1-type domain-containing protein n=1 Tax=Glomus cerebriforme TaxID=658196 RepID=A0A397TD44_9GLOM|nr:hypothetical protein C1645_734227 [Glomus cerebriforme]